MAQIEADVIEEGTYVYVTLRLPRQPPVIVINRLPVSLSVKDQHVLNHLTTKVDAHHQKSIATLQPTPLVPLNITNESSFKWLINLDWENESGVAAPTVPFALDLEAEFQHESMMDEIKKMEDDDSTKNAPQDDEGKDKNKSKTSSTDASSPHSPPHASRRRFITPPNTNVLFILTRGADGQRIITVAPKLETRLANSKYSAFHVPAPTSFELHVSVPQLKGSVCFNSREVVLLSVAHINFEAARTSLAESFIFSIDDLSVENMTEARPLYEVALHLHRVQKDKPAVRIVLRKRITQAPRFLDFSLISVNIQPILVHVGDRLLTNLVNLGDAFAQTDDFSNFFVRSPTPIDLYRSAPLVQTGSVMDLVLSIDELAINPISIRLWLKRQRDEDFLTKVTGAAWVSRLAMNLEDVTFLADGMVEQNRDRCPLPQFLKNITNNFLRRLWIQVLSVALQFVGNLPILGAPVKFLTNVGNRLTRFIVDPIADPENKSQRLAAFAKGGVSLLGGVVGGTIGVVADVTGGTAKALHMAAGTSNDAAARSKMPGIVSGLWKGVTGIVTKPLEGAANHGAKGFFKGLGHGIAGVVANPVAGVLSDVSKATGKISKVLTGTEIPNLIRSRMPRGFSATGAAVTPELILEVFEFQRLNSGMWNTGFGPSEGAPWRNRRGKECTKPMIEERYKERLQAILGAEQHIDPADPQFYSSTSSASTNQQQQPAYLRQSPFDKMWSIDRHETNVTGWGYARPNKVDFTPTQSSSRTIRRRRWVIVLPEVLGESDAQGSATSAIRRHVMGSSQKKVSRNNNNERHHFMHPNPTGGRDIASLYPPKPDCRAWVVEVLMHERKYPIRGWSNSMMIGDPPHCCTRDEVPIPKGKDQFSSQLPGAYQWLTDWYIVDTPRYGFSPGSTDWEATSEGPNDWVRRTIWRRVAILPTAL